MIAGLRRWTAETSADRQDRLECELEALLTDRNAADLWRALPPDLRETALAARALERWSRHDPAAALGWLAGVKSPSEAQIGLVVRNWLEMDFAGLDRALAQLPAGAWKERVLSAASYGALLQDRPADAIRWLGQLPAERYDPDILDSAAASWAKKDPVAAARWAGGQSDPELQDRLLAQVVKGYASTDPLEAAALARRMLLPGEAMNRAVEGIATVWAETDPAAAAGWMAEYPEAAPRQNSLRRLLGEWAGRDPVAAQTWVLTRPAGPERDEWCGQLATWALQSDPAAAISLVEKISPGPVQENVGVGVVHEWARTDYEKATAWVLRLPAGSFRQNALSELEKVITEDRRNG